MNESDYKNLSIVFAIARKEVVMDRVQLVEIMNLEDKVLQELKDNEQSKGTKED